MGDSPILCATSFATASVLHHSAVAAILHQNHQAIQYCHLGFPPCVGAIHGTCRETLATQLLGLVLVLFEPPATDAQASALLDSHRAAMKELLKLLDERAPSSIDYTNDSGSFHSAAVLTLLPCCTVVLCVPA